MPARKNTLREAPYTTGGSLMHYVAPFKKREGDGVVWLPNDPFHATFSIKRMQSGYSAKYVLLESPNSNDEREFPMFVTDLIDAVASLPAIYGGILTGRWMVRKRGQNYGVALAPE
jgi:hypothetical protein